MTAVRECRDCGTRLPYRGRGRPRAVCSSCRAEKIAEKKRAYREANAEKIAEKQRAYREANAEKIAEKQRAYYEANAEKIAEKQRARNKLLCAECGEHLLHPADDGLCGFCREEVAA